MSHSLSYYHVDAFVCGPFTGNPAGVVPLEEWLPDETMQRMAAEHNLSETAFLVRRAAGKYNLRWFTPITEIDLCGHATIASAHVISRELGDSSDLLSFESQSGVLKVHLDHDLLTLDFPRRPAEECNAPELLTEALGVKPLWTGKSRDYLVVLDSAATVRSLAPDIARIAQLETHTVIVTAPGNDCDFVSRFFAPRLGVPEDPVTGSAHCTLIPYWSQRFKKTELVARQLSRRGGELRCKDLGERVLIGGRANTYMRGHLTISD